MDQLADSDAFEALCFDLLLAEGFTDLRWRGPAADGGRDIEASWCVTDPIGGTLRTKWYCECKWYSNSVPFGELEPKLLAATAARADYLLIMTSSRVRNTAMDSVEAWLRNRGAPFQVRYWSGHDLLRLAVRHADVFAKHFPGAVAPAWGHASREMARLKALSASSADRLTWRLIPGMQWLSGRLATSARAELLREERSEINLLACLAQAYQLFTPTNIASPALVECRLSQVVELVLGGVHRRGFSIDSALAPDITTRAPRAFLVTAVFELALNSAIYSSHATQGPKVTLWAEEHHWILEFRNTSAEPLPAHWPVLVYRGPLATTKNSVGLGLGCWIASEAAALIPGGTVRWYREDDQWVAELQGSRS